MKVGFIGLGNAGGKLARTLLRNGVDLTVRDLDRHAAEPLIAKGAKWVDSPRAMAEACDMVITCLPSPAASSAAMEASGGILPGLGPRKICAERSTTAAGEIKRLAQLVAATGAAAVDCPVSGGVHRAATGNISIFAGCDRDTFERVLPVLRIFEDGQARYGQRARSDDIIRRLEDHGPVDPGAGFSRRDGRRRAGGTRIRDRAGRPTLSRLNKARISPRRPRPYNSRAPRRA